MNTSIHFNGSKLLLGVGAMLTFFKISYSQTPGRKETIDYLNSKLNPSCVIEVNGATIIACYYSNTGAKIRQDKVSSGALDTSIVYDKNEKILSIPCLGVEGDCVMRNLYLQKIKRPYARLSFAIDDENKANEIKKAFKHLIRILSEPKYKDEISFD